jgi:undecaprenyl-diphosphatase
MNGALVHHEGGQDAAQAFNASAIFVLVAVAGSIWFFGRPEGATRSKLAAVSAAAAGALALLINVVLGQLWFHDRPFVDHPLQTLLLVHHAADNSFPSDHASLAFAIGFAVIAFHRRLGVLLLLGALCIGLDRIFVGVHYPVDVLASLFVGLGAALVVTTVGRPSVKWTVEQLSRFSDPVVSSAITLFTARSRGRTNSRT